MRIASRCAVANALTVVVILIAFGLPIWQGQTRYGALELAYGPRAPLFWGLTVVWLVGVITVIRWQRRWWILLTAPSVVYPVGFAAAFTAACLIGGNCL